MTAHRTTLAHVLAALSDAADRQGECDQLHVSAAVLAAAALEAERAEHVPDPGAVPGE